MAVRASLETGFLFLRLQIKDVMVITSFKGQKNRIEAYGRKNKTVVLVEMHRGAFLK